MCDKFHLLVRNRVDSFLLKRLEIALIALAFVVSVVYVPILVHFFLEISLNLKKKTVSPMFSSSEILFYGLMEAAFSFL